MAESAPVILAETFGTKLRRLAAAAAISNPVINLPLLIPPAWATSTAYYAGQVVSANGGWYVCANSGTSASSGSGPNSVSTAGVIVDGTVYWSYIGGPTVSANDNEAPTVTQQTSSSGVPTTQWLPNTYPNLYRMYGGYPNTGVSTDWRVATFNQLSGTTQVPAGARISFYTDAPKFALKCGSNDAAYRVIVDGRYLSPTGYVSPSGNTFLILDFTSVAARKARLVEVESMSRTGNGLNFFGVFTSSSDQVWAPSTQDDVRAIMISDSYYAGNSFSGFRPGGGILHQLAKRQGWSDPWNFSIGGTGYIATDSGLGYTFGQRVTEALTRNPNLWLFMGSTNDDGQTSSAITAAALAAYQAIRAGGSTAPIIVFGVSSVSSAAATTEAAVQAAVTEFDDPLGLTFFIPICADPNFPWISGTWNNTANTSSTNASLYINTTDNIHPVETGVDYYARRMDQAIRSQVYPYLN